MATIQTDFDRIALLATDDWNHNNHYHNFLLQHAPTECGKALEIGCGTGSFSRLLAKRSKHVLALDLSPEMIRVAKERATRFLNINFEVADIRDRALPGEGFDCIASIATLHHMPLAETLLKMKASLQPGGVLLILDLFEAAGLGDALSNLFALGVGGALRVLHGRRLRPSREVREAWAEHARHDSFPTFSEVRAICEKILPGAQLRKHLLWRYSIIWQKPALQKPGAVDDRP